VKLRERILTGVAAQACRHAGVVLLVAALVTALSIAVILKNLKRGFSTDLADILPKDSEEAALFVEAAERFAADILIVAIEADDPADVQAVKPYADLLAGKLAANGEYVRAVEFKVGEKLIEFAKDIAEKRGYLFLDETDIALVKEKLSTEGIAAQMAENRRRLEAAGRDYFMRRIMPDPLDLVSLLERRRLQATGQFTPKEGEEYVISPDGTMLLMIVQAAGSAKDLSFARDLLAEVLRTERDAWEELHRADAGLWGPLRERVRLGHGGGYVIAVEQNDILTEDIRLTAVTSLIGVLLLFAIAFKRAGALFYIGTPLVASIVWTLAAAFLVFDHISVMSGGFAAILIGLSVDYAIHIYNRYISERTRGLPMEGAIEGAIVHAGGGIFFGALTTAVAFFAIAFTRFVGLSEFGILAGVGVVLGMIAMLFVQPAMLVMRNRIREEPVELARVYGFGLKRLADLIEGHPWKVFVTSAVLVLAALVFVTVELDVFFFDSDFAKLYAKSPVFEFQERVQGKFGTNLGGMVALSRGATEDEALANAARARSRAQVLLDGEKVVEVPWRAPRPGAVEENAGGLSPWVTVAGCKVRLRAAEIVLPEGEPEPEGLSPVAGLHTRSDGRRVVTYDFRSDDRLTDWTFEGEHLHRAGVDLEPGTVARWNHSVRGRFNATFSLWFQGEDAESVTLGADAVRQAHDGLSATVDGAKRDPPLTQWPPKFADQVRFTLAVEPGESARLYVGRGTLMAVESVAAFVPPVSPQKTSASFVASIDAERVARDIEAAAKAQGIRASAFRKFVAGLRGMVERAGKPELLTPRELRGSRVGSLLSKYFAEDESAPPERRYTVATYLYPERGEMDRPWYERVRRTVGRDAAEVTTARLVSLEARDIVWNDFSWIMTFVIVGVMVSLVWSFRSLVWPFPALMPLVFGFALLLASLLLIGHQLNLVNVLIFPAIVGIGIDNAIHVIHHFRESGRVRDIITETGRALILTSLTTMMGFGSLMLSRYRGLGSLGFVATLGMFFCLYSSLVALPALLAGLARRREARSGHPRRGPDDAAKSAGTGAGAEKTGGA
jgi:predicted RND superfamily exporter protein